MPTTVVGKPKEKIEVSADVRVQEKLAEERTLYEKLSPEQLKELAKESEALVEKARAMANGAYDYRTGS